MFLIVPVPGHYRLTFSNCFVVVTVYSAVFINVVMVYTRGD